MPYSKITDLPDNVRNPLPGDAQEIWMHTFNNNYKSCISEGKTSKSCEDAARIIAWVAVKNKFKKGKDGNWVRKN